MVAVPDHAEPAIATKAEQSADVSEVGTLKTSVKPEYVESSVYLPQTRKHSCCCLNAAARKGACLTLVCDDGETPQECEARCKQANDACRQEPE
jgi:hypothetical protein